MMELKSEKLKEETKVRQASDGYQSTTLSPIETRIALAANLL